MSRSLAFGRLALIATVAAAVNAGTAIGLALLGWGYISLAWGSSISTLVGMVLYLHFWRDWTIFRLALKEWRNVIGFGVHDSAGGIVYQISESVPNLIVGRVLDAASVGLFQRAVLLALFPERVILAGVGPVALPAFSQLAHEGQAKQSYLKVLGLVTAVQWPALAVLILLAHPIVQMLLGSQWQEVAPLLQVFGGALLFSFPVALQYPTLVALGAIRIVPLTTLVQVSVTLGILAFAAPAGLKIIALSTFVSVPFCGLLSLAVIRRFLKFDWLQLAAVLARSALVTVLSATGPVAVMMIEGWQHHLSIPFMMASGALAGIGWFFGLWLTRHPLWQEILPLFAKLGNQIVLRVPAERFRRDH
jgi:O-antigen/teichoic acid export membrane protein